MNDFQFYSIMAMFALLAAKLGCSQDEIDLMIDESKKQALRQVKP